MGKRLLYIFNSVNTERKASLVWDRGEHISSREFRGMIVNLYALPGFMAEIYFSSNHSVIYVKELTATSDFDMYLDQIQISDVLS
jgi:hypothetical protein